MLWCGLSFTFPLHWPAADAASLVSAARAALSLQETVFNGASALFKELYGQAGVAARIALGANELPEGSPVEICAVVEVH